MQLDFSCSATGALNAEFCLFEDIRGNITKPLWNKHKCCIICSSYEKNCVAYACSTAAK